MAVKIEVLDYTFGQVRGNEMISNSEFSTSTDWTSVPASAWTISGGKASHGTNVNAVDYLQYSNITFEQGKTYQIKMPIAGVTMGSIILANHLAGGANGFNHSQIGNSFITYQWVQGSSNTDKLSIACINNWDGEIDYIHVSEMSGIDWKNSIVGSLDVTDHTDFPLALTFQISDIRDITATTGDYSKTFKIPATKNNNNIFQHIYDPKTTDLPNYNDDLEYILTQKKSATREMPCRILVNDFYSLVGNLRVKGVGAHGKTPDYYDCVYFGNNLGWAKSVSDGYLKDLDWGSTYEDLQYNKTKIMATWQYADCDEATNASAPAMVYPIVSYGDYNMGGEDKTIQLFDTRNDFYMRGGNNFGSSSYAGYNNSNALFGTLPQSDWRPAIFVKTTLEKIFQAQGYSISSDFMNQSMFKKLVWLLPNFKRNNESADAFYQKNSFESTFTNGVTSSTDSIINAITNPPGTVNAAGVPFENVISDNTIGKFSVASISRLNTSGGNDFPEKFLTGSSRQEVDLSTSNLNISLEASTSLDASTNEITIGEYGYYTIQLTGIKSRVARVFRSTGLSAQNVFETKSAINLEVQTVGQTSWNILESSQQTHHPTNYENLNKVSATKPAGSASSPDELYKSHYDIDVGSDGSLFLNKGDKIRLTFGVQITDGTFFAVKLDHFFAAKASSLFEIRLDPKVVYFGQPYDLKDVIEPQHKQIDFVKGVAHAFNLKISTDQLNKVVTIEPFNDFYKNYGEALDWTAKLDRSKQINDNFIKNNIKRNVVYKYKSDSKDAQVKHRGLAYFKGVEDEYPYIEELPSEFERGDSIFENPFFAGTYNGRDFDTQGTYSSDPHYSGCLWEVKSSDASSRDSVPKGFDFQPRLLYWNKYSPTLTETQTASTKFVDVQTWANGNLDLIQGSTFAAANPPPSSSSIGAPYYLGGVYPQATSIDRFSTSSPVLSYGNVWRKNYDPATDTYGSPEAGKGLYETYYKNMFQMMVLNPRVRTAYIDLKISDIVNLDFRKLVYIDGVYWRINRVIDYFPNDNKTTKVELVQWLELGGFAASTPALGTGNGGSPSNWGVGIYDYGGFEDNAGLEVGTLSTGPL